MFTDVRCKKKKIINRFNDDFLLYKKIVPLAPQRSNGNL